MTSPCLAPMNACTAQPYRDQVSGTQGLRGFQVAGVSARYEEPITGDVNTRLNRGGNEERGEADCCQHPSSFSTRKAHL